VSVAAIDAMKNLASFSQRNSQVELAAPGVGVLSTLYGILSSLEVDGAMYDVKAIAYSGTGSASADLVDCGLMTSTSSCSASGKVCLIQRGDISFADKVKNCKDAGGVAAIIYNNA
jgi:serine protease